MMYDPRQPNAYDGVCQKRLDQHATANAADAARTKAADDAARAAAHARQMAPIVGDLASLTPEELHRRRVTLSARLGIEGAANIEREAAETAARLKAATGQSLAAKATSALGKQGHMGGALAPGGLEAPLKIVGGSMVGSGSTYGSIESSKRAREEPSKKTPQGKPSSTLLIRNIVMPTAHQQTLPPFDSSLQMSVQQECARYGVVRSVRLHQLPPNFRRPLKKSKLNFGVKLPEGAGSNTVLHEAERYRVFVKMDSVAAALKVADELNDRSFGDRLLVVSFYSAALFDQENFLPQPEEIPLKE